MCLGLFFEGVNIINDSRLQICSSANPVTFESSSYCVPLSAHLANQDFTQTWLTAVKIWDV